MPDGHASLPVVVTRLSAAEIKRRARALAMAAKEMGITPGGVRIAADGAITILDKSATAPSPSLEDEWLGE